MHRNKRIWICLWISNNLKCLAKIEYLLTMCWTYRFWSKSPRVRKIKWMEVLSRLSFMIDIQFILFWIFILIINKFHLSQSHLCFASCLKLQGNLESSLKTIVLSSRTYLPFSNSFLENFDWPRSLALFFTFRSWTASINSWVLLYDFYCLISCNPKFINTTTDFFESPW